MRSAGQWQAGFSGRWRDGIGSAQEQFKSRYLRGYTEPGDADHRFLDRNVREDAQFRMEITYSRMAEHRHIEFAFITIIHIMSGLTD